MNFLKFISESLEAQFDEITSTAPRSLQRQRAVARSSLFAAAVVVIVALPVVASGYYFVGSERLLASLLETKWPTVIWFAGASMTISAASFTFLMRVSRIQRAPGSRTNTLLKFLFTQKIHERVFEPMVADMQQEYFEAAARGDRFVFWIRWRGIALLAVAAAAQLPISTLNLAVRLWKAAN